VTLGGIDVPDAFLLPVVRGLLDGDGSVVNFVHAPTKRLYPNYRYERLMAQFNSASRRHLEWLRGRLEPLLRTGSTRASRSSRCSIQMKRCRVSFGSGRSGSGTE